MIDQTWPDDELFERLTPFERWLGTVLLVQGAQLLQLQALCGAKEDPKLWAYFKEASKRSLDAWALLTGQPFDEANETADAPQWLPKKES